MKGFINVPKIKKYVTVPAFIFDDDRLSMGAKGLYVQLYYSTNTVSSLEDIAELTTMSVDEVKEYFNELATVGYLSVKDGTCSLNEKTQSEKVVAKKLDTDAVEEFADSKKTKEDPMHTKIAELVKSYALDGRLTTMLIVYFNNWVFRKGRYSETHKITESHAKTLIDELLSFDMTTDEQLDCVYQSFKKEYYKFFDKNAFSEDKTKPEVSPEEKIRKITGIITTKYSFTDAVNKKLIEYFTKYVNREGRFDEAGELHGKDVHSKLIALRDFKLTEAEQLTCIQASIDKEHFVFINPKSGTSATNSSGTVTTSSTFKPFDKSTLTSGSYTDEDIRKLKERAAAAGEDGLI